MITSAENRPWPDDLLIERHPQAGLPAPPIIRPCKIATIEAHHAEAIGRIASPLLRKVKICLRKYLDLQ